MIRALAVINELDLGGAERVLVDQITHSDGMEFHVCVISGGTALASRLPRRVPIHDLGCLTRWDPRAVLRLRSIVRCVNPTIVHAHLPRAGAAAAIAMRGMGQPLVYTEHNTWSGYSTLGRPLAFLAARSADVVVAVSDSVRASTRTYARVPEARIRTIHNGVDLARLPCATPTGISGRLHLCAIGNLYARKGYPYLLRALAAIGTDSDIQLDVFGSGPELHALESLSTQLGLQDSVRFRGHHDDAASELDAYDAFCLPSLVEGLPIALIEAMGVGLPVIAAAVGGVPEVITSGQNGLLTPRGDSAALASAIRNLAVDPSLRARLGAAAARTVAEHFDVSVMARAYERLYRELS